MQPVKSSLCPPNFSPKDAGESPMSFAQRVTKYVTSNLEQIMVDLPKREAESETDYLYKAVRIVMLNLQNQENLRPKTIDAQFRHVVLEHLRLMDQMFLGREFFRCPVAKTPENEQRYNEIVREYEKAKQV